MNPILGDHNRKKKKIIPPLMELGNFKETSYVNKIIPEIIWIAILIKEYGLQDGTRLSLDLVKVASEVNRKNPAISYISSFELLSDDEKIAIKENLKKENALIKIKKALINFVTIYSDCPLRFLFDNNEKRDYDLEEIKSLLEVLYDIKSSQATFMMGTVVYHLGALGRLSLVEGSVLTKLPELKDYPNTPLSQMIASVVRATMFAMMNDELYNSQSTWNSKFWSRGIELEPCLMNDE